MGQILFLGQKNLKKTQPPIPPLKQHPQVNDINVVSLMLILNIFQNFFYLGFLSQTFKIHRAAGER